MDINSGFGEYHRCIWGISSVHQGNVISMLGNIISALDDAQCIGGIPRVPWGDIVIR